MELRPCIDIHNGRVKQLVGGSVQDQGDRASENYVSGENSAWYARKFAEKNLKNGHVILLNGKDSPYYEETKRQALEALRTYPGGLQVGGGITADNAQEYLDAGASHVIVTSYVFQNGTISFENLYRLVEKVGRNKLVLDLSCRKKEGLYYIVTDRWQKYTKVALSPDILTMLASFCDEFLIHGVDVEGKQSGIEEELIDLLGRWNQIPITYAGGIRSFEDIDKIRKAGNDRIHITIGSALDIYGGKLSFEEAVRYTQKS
ncbi:MAG: phosphoribosylformimino-5-aminoimidazole carboxamide ribotide isomerase [Lachnospiraceae bacterium]|nr:phosphoribosylformimino-5-aminoimidazole carboxamide ribotide isomerase [Lachnospiraceae bacterium]